MLPYLRVCQFAWQKPRYDKNDGNFYRKSCPRHKCFVEGKNSIVPITNRVSPVFFASFAERSTMKRSRWNVKIFEERRKRRTAQRHYWAGTRTFDPIIWTHSYQRIAKWGEAHWCQVNKGRVAHKYFIHRTARYTDVCGRTINHWTIDGGECALTVPRVSHRQRCSIKINGRLTFAGGGVPASHTKRRCDISLA